MTLEQLFLSLVICVALSIPFIKEGQLFFSKSKGFCEVGEAYGVSWIKTSFAKFLSCLLSKSFSFATVL